MRIQVEVGRACFSLTYCYVSRHFFYQHTFVICLCSCHGVWVLVVFFFTCFVMNTFVGCFKLITRENRLPSKTAWVDFKLFKPLLYVSSFFFFVVWNLIICQTFEQSHMMDSKAVRRPMQSKIANIVGMCNQGGQEGRRRQDPGHLRPHAEQQIRNER